MARRAQIAAVMTLAIGARAMLAAGQGSHATPTRTVTITGCVQRMDESGKLGTTIPEHTATPEQRTVF